MGRSSRFYRRGLILSGLGIVALVLFLDAVGGLSGPDLSSIDWRFSLRGSLGPPRNIVVVGIDDRTFNYLDRVHPGEAHFPFARRLDARVIQNLAADHARVIGYDEQYTEATNPVDDNALIRAVRSAGNVVLATTEVGPHGATRIFGGGQALLYSRATPAQSQFPVDSDGRIRRTRDQILGLTTFPVAVAQRALGHRIAFPSGRNASALIDFRGPAGTVPEIPYWRVLEGRFPPRTFRNKIVLVGAAEPILHDDHQTPTSNQMPGVEVQANAVDTILRGFPLHDAPGWVNGFLILVLALIAPLLALRFPATLAAGAALAGLVVLALACQLAFNSGVVVGFVYPALAAILSMASTLLLNGLRATVEREFIRDTFARFVPESIVTQVLAQADGARLGGVRREATVLFSDLRGFTSFAEQREPSETIDILNRYLTLMSDKILEHGGTLVSYMGDGIMAVFGAPLEQADHADRALAAARAMLAELEEFNSWMQSEGHGQGFKMGIGLNSGEVMSGNVGSQRRLEYTTIGDTTNTASRLESMTKGTPHQLYIADSTHTALVNDPGDLERVAELEVRGRQATVTVWTLAGDRSAATAGLTATVTP